MGAKSVLVHSHTCLSLGSGRIKALEVGVLSEGLHLFPTGLWPGGLPQALLSRLTTLVAHACLLSRALPNTFSSLPPTYPPCSPWWPSPAHRESSWQLTFQGA